MHCSAISLQPSFSLTTTPLHLRSPAATSQFDAFAYYILVVEQNPRFVFFQKEDNIRNVGGGRKLISPTKLRNKAQIAESKKAEKLIEYRKKCMVRLTTSTLFRKDIVLPIKV